MKEYLRGSFYLLCAAVLSSAQLWASGGFRVADVAVVAPDAYFGKRAYHSIASWGGGAMDDLTNALSKVTGTKIALYRESAVPAGVGRVIYLGDTASAREAGVADAKIRNLGFRERIACSSGRGPRRALLTA